MLCRLLKEMGSTSGVQKVPSIPKHKPIKLVGQSLQISMRTRAIKNEKENGKTKS